MAKGSYFICIIALKEEARIAGSRGEVAVASAVVREESWLWQVFSLPNAQEQAKTLIKSLQLLWYVMSKASCLVQLSTLPPHP